MLNGRCLSGTPYPETFQFSKKSFLFYFFFFLEVILYKPPEEGAGEADSHWVVLAAIHCGAPVWGSLGTSGVKPFGSCGYCRNLLRNTQEQASEPFPPATSFQHSLLT